MFAIVKTGGKQYKVEPGQKIKFEKLSGEQGEVIELSEVLAVNVAKDKTQIGAPFVEGAKVKVEILEQKKDDKIIVFKKKRRQNYRRKKGHRQLVTIAQIKEICVN